jgi:hypothetical protein
MRLWHTRVFPQRGDLWAASLQLGREVPPLVLQLADRDRNPVDHDVIWRDLDAIETVATRVCLVSDP